MTPKQKVLKKYPKAELVRDGWDKTAGPSGCYDFAVYVGDWPMAFAESAREAWAWAAKRMRAS